MLVGNLGVGWHIGGVYGVVDLVRAEVASLAATAANRERHLFRYFKNR